MKNGKQKYNAYLSWLSALLTLSISSLAVADLAQAPLFLTTTAKPNVMLMLDNSISMSGSLAVSSTPFNPGQTYLSTANCASNPMPTTTTQNLSGYNANSCSNAGGTYLKINGNWRCQFTTPITYTSTVPTDFFGKRSGYSVGTKCFVGSQHYTTNLTLPASVVNDTTLANYLNWYYSDQLAQSGSSSTRLTVAKDAATNLVNSLDNKIRFGFATFNVDNGGKLWEVVDDLTDTKKANIINRISSTNADSHTPLSETMADIGRYFATGSSQVKLRAGQSNASIQSTSTVLPSELVNGTNWSGRTAIAGEPSFSSNPIQYSCQKNFTVLMTDGLPSSDRDIANNSYLADYDGDCSDSNSANCGIKNGGNWLTPHYDMKRNYNYPGTCNNSSYACVDNAGSNSSDYLDDVTYALYEMDLRPDLRNSTESSNAKNNLTTFVIGFADNAINPNITGVNPLPKDAAIQGGGKFYFAGDQAQLSASLASAFSIISEQAGSSSSVATNSTQFQTDTLVYQGLFDSSDWSGDLKAFRLVTEDANGNGRLDSSEDLNGNGQLDGGEDANNNGILDSSEDLNGNGKLDAGAIGVKVWSAAESMPAYADRNLFSYNPTTAAGIPLSWTELDTTQTGILGSEAVLNYLKGQQSGEKKNGGIYRSRSSILGDIINSDPLFVGRDDAGYTSLSGTEGSSYTDFAKTSRRSMIYVAANDGMLHGFDATADATGGGEIFAYMPNAAINANLVALTDPNYSHRYILDGSPQTGDVYYNDHWHTVLVGGMGAGGKSLFALDVTDPDTFAKENVLWEFSHADMGYTMAQASIVRLANGQWGAVVSNGYESTAGKASLFILNIQTGSVIKRIDAEIASGTNGLAAPAVVDIDGDKIADYVYAGDLKGNLWKFDISSANTADWGVAYGGSPLFVATDSAGATQPITAKPAAIKAEGKGQSGGVMVYVGTGKYFETGDNIVPTTPQLQTFYGIWDICGKSTSGCNGVVSGRSQLQQQTITYEGSSGTTTLADGSTVDGDVRVVSDCEVSYDNTVPLTIGTPCTSNTSRRGWYLDFIQPAAVKGQGERIVSNAVVRYGVVIFPTLIPINATCSPGGNSWLMELDAYTGARLTGGTPVDLNNDQRVTDADKVKVDGQIVGASGFKSTVGIIDTPAIINCEDGMDCKYASGSSGSLMMKKERAPSTTTEDPLDPPTEGGSSVVGQRRSWQQLR